MISQSILKILLIIDYKSVISIMLIIPEDILFKHATANNVQEAFLIIKLEYFPALLDLIGLITSIDDYQSI